MNGLLLCTLVQTPLGQTSGDTQGSSTTSCPVY